MVFSWLLSLLLFLWIAAITPGPNNMLLTSTAANFGFKRSMPVLLGIVLGVQTLLLLVVVGVGGLLTLFPSLYLVLKVLGSAYLLWIAWKIAMSGYQKLDIDVDVKPISLFQAALLQFLNPKAWLMALGAVSSFGLANMYLPSMLVISISILSINVMTGMIWAGFGAAIGRLLRSQKAWVVFNFSMGLLTASCVILIWL